MILLVPSLRRGNGGGHLKRAVGLSSTIPDSCIFIPEDYSDDLIREKNPLDAGLRLCMGWDHIPENVEYALLDQRETDPSMVERLRMENIPLVALDEGGPCRKQMDYLIDSLPLPGGFSPPNLRVCPVDSPRLKGLPWDKREPLLISFGMEDPEDLTGTILKHLLEMIKLPEKDITVVIGPFFRKTDLPEGVQRIESPDSLKEILGNYRLVFTSFGLTAYEALSADSRILLFNPTVYHRTLSRLEGFPEIGVKKVKHCGLKKIQGILQSPEQDVPETDKRLPLLMDTISELEPKTQNCPCCRKKGKLQRRFPKGNFHFCPVCRNLYFVPQLKDQTEYNEAYFFESYEAQYGKTYLEDFEHIKNLGRSRLDNIQRYCGWGKGRLTDLGCAYGPFLQAAGEAGFQPRGVDISPNAVLWVREQLGWDCHLQSLFSREMDEMMITSPAEILTLWYVIEHFPDQKALWERLSRWIVPGGALALATPYGNGISYRKNQSRFFALNPLDHFIIYRKKGIKKLLKLYGFRLKKQIVTGHHPERISPLLSKNKLGYRLLLWLSRFFSLGDTFEIYAVKE